MLVLRTDEINARLTCISNGAALSQRDGVLHADQHAQIMKYTGAPIGPLAELIDAIAYLDGQLTLPRCG